MTTLLALPVFYSWRDTPYDWTAIGLSFALLHAWVPTSTTYFAGNPASWSLSCEMFFYAVHPFLVRRVLRWTALALVAGGLVILGAVYGVAISTATGRPIAAGSLYVSPLFRIGEFLLGVLLAVAIRRGYRFPAYLLPSVLLLGAWFYLYYQYSPQHFPVEGQLGSWGGCSTSRCRSCMRWSSRLPPSATWQASGRCSPPGRWSCSDSGPTPCTWCTRR